VEALKAHKKSQAAERLAAGEAWHDNDLVFYHPDGRPYTRDGLNYRFGQVTQGPARDAGTPTRDATRACPS
jgi:hypothetical protein